MADIDFQFPHLFREVMDANIFEAEIIDIDYAVGTASILWTDTEGEHVLEGVEIFYNCECGTTEHGATAFEEGDAVYVLNPNGECTPSATDPFSKARIIGFVNVETIRHCKIIFNLRLTRGDGLLIDDAKFISYGRINFFDTEFNPIPTGISRQYDPATERHTFMFEAPIVGGIPETKFYIKGRYKDYSIDGYVWFPDKYQSIYILNPPLSCLREEGSYDFEFPYWKVEDTVSGSTNAIGGVRTHSITVYSSIPYKITHYVTEQATEYHYIRYSCAFLIGRFVEDELCCYTVDDWPNEDDRVDIFDINPLDPLDPDLIEWEQPETSNGGWGNSLISLTLASDELSHVAVFPSIDYSEEVIETLGANISGGVHTMTLTNTTPAHSWRIIPCGPVKKFPACDVGGDKQALYQDAYSGLIWGLKDVTYDFE